MRQFLHALIVSMFVFAAYHATAQTKAPTYVSATVTAQNHLQLSWTKVAPPASKYRVYRNGMLVHTSVGLNDTIFVDNNPLAGQVLQYCVTTLDGMAQESPYRNCILDSTYYFNVLLASDSTSDAFIDISWSVDVSCLRTTQNHDVYVELWDNNTNKEIYGQEIKNGDLPDDTAATVSVRLSTNEYMLLDPSYVSPGNAALQQAGRAVFIDGDYAIVGAPLADGGEGAALIYELQGGNWVHTATLKAPAPSLSDSFAVSVNLRKRFAIVGAPGGLGLAHVYERTGGNTWVHRAALEADVRDMTDDFGRAVAIDTFYALVSAPQKYAKAGVIYHYIRNGNNWIRLTRFFSRTPKSNQFFGSSISAEDRFMVAGGPGDLGNRGSAFAYEMVGFTWYFRTQLVISNLLVNDQYGTSVAISNGHIAVGAPGYQSNKGRGYYFRKVGLGWVANGEYTPNDANTGDRYGTAMSMYLDRLIVGAPNRVVDNGAVYLHELSGQNWSQTDKWVRDCGESADGFGSALAMGDDVAMIGAAYENGGQSSVYRYHYIGNTWVDQTPLGGLVVSPRTIELWVKLNGSHGGFRPIIGSNDVSLNAVGALPQLNIRSGGVPVYFNYRMPHDRWTHVALVVDSITRKTRLYINGELTDELCVVSGLDVERIGYQAEGITQHYLHGQVFDVRSWSKVRAQAEIFGDYRQRVSAPQPGLAGYWEVDEGTGSNIGESTGNYPAASVQPSNTPDWVIDSIAATIAGEFTHVVGPGKHHGYQLNTYEVGFGYPLCPVLSDSGHTLPYIIPVVASDSSRPDSMRMSWTNHSDAISFYRIFRDGQLLGLIDSTTEAWADTYKYNDTATLQNSQTYRYCLVPFSTRFNLVYDSICVSGSTLPINFEATRDAHMDKVVMTWDNMSAFGDGIRILRDGEFKANLDSNVTSYTDQNPLAGFQHVYEFQLLQGHNIMVAVQDTGSIPARGTIAGRVVTAVGDYALAGVVIQAEAIIGGDTITYSDTSGLTGDFKMEEVFFGNGATFSITATVPASLGYTIANSPLSAMLNFANPSTFITFTGTKVINPTGNGPLTFTNFNAQHISGQDLVRLTWNYTNPDTTWFKIYRNGILIDIITDTNAMALTSYDDLTGIPGTTYNYEVQAYRYESDSVVTEKNGTDTELLDGLAAVQALFAVAHNGEGVVKLHWDHTSTNITGFRLYRGVDWIADLTLIDIQKDSFYRYTDYYGIPGENYIYGIRAYVEKDGNEYVSPITYSNQVTYPGLPAPSPVLATPDPVNDQMVITWAYQKADNANFFGFRLVRNGGGNTDTLTEYHKGFISGETGGTWQYTYVDRTGKPSTSYTYSVVAYKASPYFQSPPGSDTKVYPAVSLPHNLQATLNIHPGYVKLTWDAVSNNHDGYLLIRGSDTLGWLGKDIRSFTDVFTTSPTYLEYTYRLRAFREVNGMKYVSNQITKQGSAQVLANGNLLAPQNFKASDNYPNHILLTWDYPVYILSRFLIYKDGALYDSVDNSLRFYVDTAAVPDQKYVYQIRGRHQGVWSAMATDVGSLKSIMQVEGIASSNNGIGIPGIQVLVAIDGVPMYQTQTDSTGFYRVAGVRNKSGSLVTVSAAGPNAMFIEPVKQFNVVAGQNRYTVNFTDTFYHNLVPMEEEVASPVGFVAYIDKLTNKVELHWNVSSNNFSGFTIHRDLSFVADIPWQAPKSHLDIYASPGIFYTYSLQAYLQKPEGNIYSDTAYVDIEVPKLAPIEGLYALPDFTEDIVKLYWSHPTDQHTFYEIKRNNTVIGTVETGNRLYFVDSTGLPSHIYKYTITAIEIGDFGLFKSDPVSTTTKFPDVAPVNQIVTTPVPADNRVDVTWNHTSIYYAYALIYRNGIVIDTVHRSETPKLTKDYWGIPGALTDYAVQAVVVKDNNTYFSDTTHVSTTFPVILPPTINPTTPGVDMLTVDGSYAPVDGYTGFEFYRWATLLESKSGIAPNFEFNDMDGAPDSVYQYRVRTFKDIPNSSTYYSAYTDINGTFPSLESPFACSASFGLYYNHVEITWEHISNANTGFVIYKDNVVLDTIRNSGARRYIDLYNNTASTTASQVYKVQAYKDKDAVRYYSGFSNDATGYALIQQFSTITTQSGTSNAENLGHSVAMSPAFAIAGTEVGSSIARTFIADASGNFSADAILAADSASGTSSAFGYSVAIKDNMVAVTAPWAWGGTNTGHVGYRAGEIYQYSLNGSVLTQEAIIRNQDWEQEEKGSSHLYNATNNISITESMEFVSISAINNVPSSVGPANSGIGSVSSSTDFTNGLNFTTDGPFVLNSVTVYPDSGSGNIVVRVRQGATIISSTSVPYSNATPYASTVVNLGANIPAAGNYSIDAVGSTINNLRLNTNGASFPYTDGYDIVSITGNIAGGGGSAPYRYFYNWQVNVPGDTVGVRAHEDTLVYTREVILPNFNANFPEGTTGQDIMLDEVIVLMRKAGGQQVWLEDVTLDYNNGTRLIRLFSTNSSPGTCDQDSIQAIFPASGGTGPLASSGDCDSIVSGRYTPIDNIEATFNAAGLNPSGQYRLRYKVKMIDPNPAIPNTLTANVNVDAVFLKWSTLPGGIYLPLATKNQALGHSVAVTGSTIAAGAPQAGTGGFVKTFIQDTSSAWMTQSKLLAPASAIGACHQYQVVVATDVFWLSNFATWTLRDNTSTIIASGTGSSNISVISDKAPLTFSITATHPIIFFYTTYYSVYGNNSLLLNSYIQPVVPSNTKSHSALTAPCDGPLTGWDVALEGDKMLVGSPRANSGDGYGPKGLVQYYKLDSDGQWKHEQDITIPNVGGGDDQFGYAMDIDNGTLAVGAYGDDWDANASVWDAGSVSIYEFSPTSGTFVYSRKIFNPDNPKKLFEHFGAAIDINENLMAIGAPKVDATGGIVNAGAVYLYEKDDNDVWIFKKRYFAPDAQANAFFGKSVALAGNTLMVGAPGHDVSSVTDAGQVYFIYVREQIDSVIASDGTEGNKTRISWVYNGVRSNLSNFHVYRDGILIAAADNNKSFVFDYDGIPGKKYVYQVTPVSLDDVEGVPKGDEGWSAPNGILDGLVLTFDGQVGVPGIFIEAWTHVDGERFSYIDTTDQTGKYKIKNVYYSDSSRVFARAWYPGQEFIKDTLDIEFNLQQNQKALDPFYTTTAYVVRGIVRHIDVNNCGIDSVDVTQTKVFKNNSTMVEVSSTADGGQYSFVVQPHNTDILRYEYTIANQRLIMGQQLDTIHFQFSPDSQDIQQAGIVQKVTTLPDFVDTTRYKVEIFVQNVCGPIGQNRWRVLVESKDGCYKNLVTTFLNGKIELLLPPLEYNFRVVGVETPTPNTLPVVDYLKVRPRQLNLAEIHRSFKGAVVDTTLNLDFVFHVSPIIAITNLSDFLCADPLLPVVVNQGDAKKYTIQVQEEFGSMRCDVNEGFLIIRNNAARETQTQLDYDPQLGRFPDYEFVVGEPNIISPYVKFMFVEYHTESDGFLGEYAVAFLIQGTAQVPGNDIIVTPASDGQDVMLPLMILRDPPGDGSFVKIDSGTTFESTLKVTDEYAFTVGLDLEIIFKAFGTGIKLEIESKVGGGFGRETEFKLKTETTKSIQTSDASDRDRADNLGWFTGDRADVIAGTGLALQYGIGRRISVDPQCNVRIEKVITLGAEVQTMWVYTLDQIIHLSEEYEKNIVEANEGRYVIKDNTGTEMTKAETVEFLTTRLNNWGRIRHYHSVETKPHYSLCDPKNFADIPEPWKSAAEEWRTEGFCNLIGTYSADGKTFTMNPDSTWQWDTDLVNRYNKVRQKVKDIEDYLSYSGGIIYNETLLNQVQIDQGYLSMYGPDARNITFSGGAQYDEEFTIGREKGTTFKHKVTGGAKIAGSTVALGKVVMFTGAWVGFGGGAMGGTVIELLETGFSLKPSFEFEITYEEEKGTTHGLEQKMAYTLTDDDPGDQFSVTIVRGPDASHSPYFSLLGGRSSCPHEPGTIHRDVPQIELMHPNNVGANNTIHNADPNMPVIFPLKLSNLNPFGETRWYEVYLVENSNPLGATVKVNGKPIGARGTSAGSGEEFFIPAEGSVFAYLTIERNPYFYNYEEIGIGLRPTCDPYIYDDVYVNVYFRHPCSDISIIEPYDGWVINSDTSLLAVYMADYDPYNPLLERVQMVYRRMGTMVWDTILSLGPDSLISYYERYKPTYPHPTYPFVWDISTIPNLIDGEYELMAIASCGTGGIITSNRVKGTIDRSSFRIFGTPQPSDGLLSLGEEISVSFNKAIDCPVSLSTAKVVFNADSMNGPPVTIDFACFNNKMVFIIPNLMQYEGRMIYAHLDSVYDHGGNKQIAPAIWSFRVSNNPIYWYPAAVELTVERGKQATKVAHLKNTGGGHYGFMLANNQNWMQRTPGAGNVPPAGQPVTLEVDASNLAVGTYYDTVSATITGFTTIKLPVTVHVIQPLPDWSVDPTQFEHSVQVVANANIDSTGLSTDTMDVITAWIDGELRGMGRVQKVGSGYHAAYVLVHGHTADANKPVDFRVWDASRGAEFQGHADQNVTFNTTGAVYGTTPNPVVIWVNTAVDSLRYIPLKQGWNWFSLNLTQPDMSLNSILRSLSPTTGDVLMSHGNVSAEYLAGSGWISFGLDSIRTTRGYMLHLTKADTLRLSGLAATNDLMFITAGWSMIGYQPQQPDDIHDAFLSVIPAFENGDVLKNQTEFSIYNADSTRWEGSLQTLRPYQAYKVRVGKAHAIYYRGTGPAHWQIEPAAYEHNMRVMAVVNINGFEFRDTESKVAAFINGEVRGVATLTYVPEMNRYMAPLMVYSNDVGAEVSFMIWDGLEDTVFVAAQTLAMEPTKLNGRLRYPVVLTNIGTGTGTDARQEAEQQVFRISPNPFEEELAVDFHDQKPGTYRIVMYNTLGDLVLSERIESQRGENRVVLRPKATLAAGVYYVTVRRDDAILQTFKVVKMQH